MLTVKKILLGACYGFCTIMLIKGGVVKPLILSQALGAVTALLTVSKVVTEVPKVWFAIGFVAGGIITWFLNIT